jgi:hypothetical protein
LLVGVGVAAAVVVLPFFLWSPANFLDAVIRLHLAIGPDVQSLTARSAVHHFLGLTLPSWLALASTVLLTGWVAWRTPAGERGIGLWLGTTLLIFSLFFVKGYFNYFYLCSYLFLLGVAALNPNGESAVAVQAPPAEPATVRRAA